MIEFKLTYLPWMIGILVAGYFLLRALRVIIIGLINIKKLGKDEFLKKVSEGFDNITPLQKAKGELEGIIISLMGLVIGLMIVPIYRIEGFWYWIELTLFGGAILTIWQLIGKIQHYRVLKKQDKLIEELS